MPKVSGINFISTKLNTAFSAAKQVVTQNNALGLLEKSKPPYNLTKDSKELNALVKLNENKITEIKREIGKLRLNMQKDIGEAVSDEKFPEYADTFEKYFTEIAPSHNTDKVAKHNAMTSLTLFRNTLIPSTKGKIPEDKINKVGIALDKFVRMA